MRRERGVYNGKSLKRVLLSILPRDEWKHIISIIADFVYHEKAYHEFDSKVHLGIYWDFSILDTPMVAGYYHNSTAQSAGIKIGYQVVRINDIIIHEQKEHVLKRDDWYLRFINGTERFGILFRETIQRTMDTELLGVCSTHPDSDGAFTMMICDGKYREFTMHRKKNYNIWRGYYYLINKKRFEIIKQYEERQGRILRFVVDAIYGKRYILIGFKKESEKPWGCAVNFNSNIGPPWKVKLTSKDQWYRRGVKEGWTVIAVVKGNDWFTTEYCEDVCEKLLQLRGKCSVLFRAKLKSM